MSHVGAADTDEVPQLRGFETPGEPRQSMLKTLENVAHVLDKDCPLYQEWT